MTERALIASRSGAVTPWVEQTVAALGYDVTAQLTAEAPEHGRYHVPPGLVDRLRTRLDNLDVSLVAVDGLVHPGQAVDLASALPQTTIRDRRGVVWERLAAGGNSAAERSLALRTHQTERRRAARDQREDSTRGPTGTSGRVEELDRRCQRARESAQTARDDQRRRVETAHDGVDQHVALVGAAGESTGPLRAALTDSVAGEDGPFTPARPVTETTSIGPHDLAVTDTPGIPPALPEWYARAVPGTLAALDRADVVVLAGSSNNAGELAQSVCNRTDGVLLLGLPPDELDGAPDVVSDTLDRTAPDSVRARVADHLPTVRLGLWLPYSDGAHALVSRLHDRADVLSVDYDDTVAVTVDVPAGVAPELRRRVDSLGGDCDEASDPR
ncbi:MAG: GTPase [uncultured archaeon A07HR67]|jgi:GTPases|nr:MAG: GTPase [uncultured archaeon A07HR67]